MNDIVFAFDFSVAKPAMTVFTGTEFLFYMWPLTIDPLSYDILTKLNVNVRSRKLTPMRDKKRTSTELMNEHMLRSRNLADMIVTDVKDILAKYSAAPENCVIVNEGFSFGSTGQSMLDLAGYKYILLDRLISCGFKEFVTYSPILIKSTAGCAYKGSTKDDIVNSFINTDNFTGNLLIDTMRRNRKFFVKKTHYMKYLDDIADSYFCCMTYLNKTAKE